MEGVDKSQARVSSKLAVMAMRAAGPVVVVSRSWRVAAGVAGKNENPVGVSVGVLGGASLARLLPKRCVGDSSPDCSRC